MRNLPRTAGHLEGLKALKRVVVSCRNHDIPFTSYYVFSTENWKRSSEEVNYLMHLLQVKLTGEIGFFRRENVRVIARGNIPGLPEGVRKAISEAEKATADRTGITACLLVNYGGQDEIARAVNRLIAQGKKDVTAEDIGSALALPGIPPVDMIVRSAGERRLSNFLLWDSAYAELASYSEPWPDWGDAQVVRLLDDYRSRTRKFGGVQE